MRTGRGGVKPRPTENVTEAQFGVTAAAAVAVAVAVAVVPPHQSVTSDEKSRKQALQDLASSLNARANQLRDKELRSSLLDLMSADSLGLDSDAVPLHRFIPVYVYLGGGENPEGVLEALANFSKELGVDFFDSEAPVISSFWEKIWGKTSTKKTKKELEEAYSKGKEALEVSHIEKPRSEIELNRANAAAALLTAMGNDSKSTAVLYGELLILSLVDKNGDRHNRAITLTKEQNQYIQTNLDVLKDPDTLLARIDGQLKLASSR